MSRTTKGTAVLPPATALHLCKTGSRLLDRSTAVVFVAPKGHTLITEQLIATGAALDVQNNAGYGRCADCNGLTLCKMGSRLLGRNAAVILAASNGHTPVVEKLIAAGAALDVHNVYG